MEYTVHKTEYLDEQGLEELWKKIKAYVAEHGGNGGNPGSIDLSDYATKEYVTQAIENIPDIDLSGYVVAENLATTLLDYAKKNHTHSEYLTEHQDISGKADVGHKHVKADITDYTEPDLSNYATQTYVTEQIANAQLGGSGGSVDLSAYAKTEEVNTELAKKAEKEHTHTISQISDYVPTDLSNYYNKEETYSKTEIDNKISSSGSGSSSGGSSTEFYSTDEVAIGTWVDGKTIYRKVLTKSGSDISYGSRSGMEIGCTIDTCIKARMILIGNVSGTDAQRAWYTVEGAYLDSFVSSSSSASALLTNIKNDLIYISIKYDKVYYYIGNDHNFGTDAAVYIITEYTKKE